MSIPKKSKVKTVLEPYHPILAEITLGAWEDWRSSSECGRTIFSRTRANIIFDRMISRAREVFSGMPSIRIVERVGTEYFVADDQVLFRFKKGNVLGLSGNVRTQLSLAFHDHDQRSLFDHLDLDRVEVVYTLNKLETKIANILVVGRDGYDLAWAYSIIPEADVIVDAPFAPVAPVTPPELLVRLRDGDEALKVNQKKRE